MNKTKLYFFFFQRCLTCDVFGCYRIWLQSGAVAISDFGYNIIVVKQIHNNNFVVGSIQLFL